MKFLVGATFLIWSVLGTSAAPPILTGRTHSDAPEIDDLMNVTVYSGEKAELTCKILELNTRPVYLQWLKYYTVNGSYLNETGDPYVKQIKQAGILAPNEKIDVLTFEKVGKHAEGIYTCVVGNSRGVAYKSAWLTVLEEQTFVPASAPKNVRVVSTDPGAALIEWDEPDPPTGEIEGYKIYFKTDPKPQNARVALVMYGREQRRAMLNGLDPGKTYTISVIAFTKFGESPPSEGILVDILQNEFEAPDTSYSAPRLVRVVSQTETTLMLEWEEPHKSSGEIEGYYVYYTTKPHLPIHLWQKETKRNNRILFLTGLERRKTYYISVRAFSRSGEGSLSEPISAITRKQESKQIKYLKAKVISPTVIQVHWRHPVETEKIIYYTLYFNESTQQNSEQVNITPPSSQYMMTDLTPDTIYRIQVVGHTAGNERVLSEVIQVKTHEFIPGEPEILRIEPINSTAIYVRWVKLNSPHPGVIRGYYVFYAEINEDDEPVSKWEMEDTGDGEKTRMTISGLKPDTRYSVTVAGYTRKGDGLRSAPRFVTTTNPVPSIPLNLKATFIQLEPPLVNISWDTPELTYGKITGYRMFYGPHEETNRMITLQPRNMSYITGGFERGVTYEFRVMAKNENGYGNAAVLFLPIPDRVTNSPETTTTRNQDMIEEVEVYNQEPLALLNKVVNGMEEIKSRLQSLENKVEVRGQCEDGWLSYKDSCYLFEDRSKLTWQQASVYCSQLDGTLLVPKTADEEGFIIGYLRRFYKGRTKYKNFVWIGATDAKDDGEWVWYIDGSAVFADPLRLPGLLEELNQSADVKWNCAGMNGKKDFRSSPRHCEKKAHFACQKRMSEAKPAGCS